MEGEAVIALAQGWEDIERYAKAKKDWLGRFLMLEHSYTKPCALVKPAVNYDGKVIQYGERYGCQKILTNHHATTRQDC
jgi:hypothetical protein